MDMERLSMVAPELAEDLRSLGEAECRRAASVGASIVVERAGLMSWTRRTGIYRTPSEKVGRLKRTTWRRSVELVRSRRWCALYIRTPATAL